MPSGSRGGQHLLRCSLQIPVLPAAPIACLRSQPCLDKRRHVWRLGHAPTGYHQRAAAPAWICGSMTELLLML
jgi:hypothetical protein